VTEIKFDRKRAAVPAWSIIHGEVPTALDELAPESIHACVTDPPYELGFMGKSWDGSGVAFRPETWAAVLRVLKPGAHLIAFGGSRTYHRIACAIEDAGFELRDTLMWIYGSGFPKSLDVSKAIDRRNGDERPVRGVDVRRNAPSGIVGAGRESVLIERKITSAASAASAAWDGWGTALKPSFEPVILARKPLGGTVAACVLEHGTGALNIDTCRIPFRDEDDQAGAAAAAAQRSGQDQNANRRAYSNFNDGAGSLQPYLDGLDRGRWPANVLHDDSPDVRLHLGDARRFFYSPKASAEDREEGTHELELKTLHRVNPGGIENDPKWAPRQRRNTHVTVKPSGLMEWLVRLVCPPGGTILDPFAGSGTTGVAALRQGFGFVGVEMLEEHVTIARARVGWAALHPLERAAKKADQATLFDQRGEDDPKPALDDEPAREEGAA
jgi:DNA modification methylase